MNANDRMGLIIYVCILCRGVSKDDSLTCILNRIGITVSQRSVFRNESVLSDRNRVEIQETGCVAISKLIIGKFTIAIADNIDRISHDTIGNETKFSHGLVSCLVQEHSDGEYIAYQKTQEYCAREVDRLKLHENTKLGIRDTVGSLQYPPLYCKKFVKETHEATRFSHCFASDKRGNILTPSNLNTMLSPICIFNVGKEGSNVRSVTRFV